MGERTRYIDRHQSTVEWNVLDQFFRWRPKEPIEYLKQSESQENQAFIEQQRSKKLKFNA